MLGWMARPAAAVMVAGIAGLNPAMAQGTKPGESTSAQSVAASIRGIYLPDVTPDGASESGRPRPGIQAENGMVFLFALDAPMKKELEDHLAAGRVGVARPLKVVGYLNVAAEPGMPISCEVRRILPMAGAATRPDEKSRVPRTGPEPASAHLLATQIVRSGSMLVTVPSGGDRTRRPSGEIYDKAWRMVRDAGWSIQDFGVASRENGLFVASIRPVPEAGRDLGKAIADVEGMVSALKKQGAVVKPYGEMRIGAPPDVIGPAEESGGKPR